MSLGVVLFTVGYAQEAVNEERIAIEFSEHPSGEVFEALGKAYYYAEDLASAKEAFEYTLELYKAKGVLEDKELMDVYGSLGVIYRELHHYDQAAAMFDKFEALLPLDKTYLRQNEITLAKNRGILAFDRGDMTKAEEYLQAAESRQRMSSS